MKTCVSAKTITLLVSVSIHDRFSCNNFYQFETQLIQHLPVIDRTAEYNDWIIRVNIIAQNQNNMGNKCPSIIFSQELNEIYFRRRRVCHNILPIAYD